MTRIVVFGPPSDTNDDYLAIANWEDGFTPISTDDVIEPFPRTIEHPEDV